MRIRASRTLLYIGAVLLLLSVAIPLLVKGLHTLGVLEGWDGFGAFVISLQLMPWTAAAGVLLLILGLMGRRKRATN